MDWAKRALRRQQLNALTGTKSQPWATTINGMGGCWKTAWPKFACKKKKKEKKEMPMALSDNKTTEEEEEDAWWEESAASLII